MAAINLAPLSIKSVSAERFSEMLNILPPMTWNGLGTSTETFKMSEFEYCDITTVFCRIGTNHFELKADYRISHREIEEFCKAHQVNPPVSA
jgi:hypothetical protein